MLLDEVDDGNDRTDIDPVQLLYITRGHAALFVLDQPDISSPLPLPLPLCIHRIRAWPPPFSQSSVTLETSAVSGPSRIILQRSHHIINNTLRNSVAPKRTAIVNLSLRMNNLLDSRPPSQILIWRQQIICSSIETPCRLHSNSGPLHPNSDGQEQLRRRNRPRL